MKKTKNNLSEFVALVLVNKLNAGELTPISYEVNMHKLPLAGQELVQHICRTLYASGVQYIYDDYDYTEISNIKSLKKFLNDNKAIKKVVLWYGNIVFKAKDIQKELQYHLSKKADCTVLTTNNEEEQLVLLEDEKGKITGIDYKPKEYSTYSVFMNYLYKKQVKNTVPSGIVIMERKFALDLEGESFEEAFRNLRFNKWKVYSCPISKVFKIDTLRNYEEAIRCFREQWH